MVRTRKNGAAEWRLPEGGAFMKFTDGMWMTKDGFTVETPGEIYEVAADAEGLTLYCPYVAVQHRGNTLDGGLLTVRMTAGAAQHDRRASDEPPRRVRRHAALPAQPRHREGRRQAGSRTAGSCAAAIWRRA